MTLGDELRAALGQEAEMQNVVRPDVAQLILGGRARKRRRNATRASSAALVVVLLGGGVYGATQLGDGNPEGSGIVDQPTSTAEASGAAPATLAADPGRGDLEAGTYRVLVGSDSAGSPIEADLTVAGPGWRSGNFPVLQDSESVGGFGVYQPFALAAASGCSDDLVSTELGDSPHSLAQLLAELPGSTILQPVTAGEVLGRSAVHLRLRIPQECAAPEDYRPAETPRGGRGITYPRPDEKWPPVVMDFWVLELDGVLVVVDSWHQVGASAELVNEIARSRDSISFAIGE